MDHRNQNGAFPEKKSRLGKDPRFHSSAARRTSPGTAPGFLLSAGPLFLSLPCTWRGGILPGVPRSTAFAARSGPSSARASRRRSLDERLRVRFPGIFHLLGRLCSEDAATAVSPAAAGCRPLDRPHLCRGQGRDFDLIRTFNDLSVSRFARVPTSATRSGGGFERSEGYLGMWQLSAGSVEDIRIRAGGAARHGDKVLVTAEQKGARIPGSGVAVGQDRVPALHVQTRSGDPPGGLPRPCGGPRSGRRAPE